MTFKPHEVPQPEPEQIAVNDASFNMTYKPHALPKDNNSDTTKSTFMEKLSHTTSAISGSMDFSMDALLTQAWGSLDNFFMNPKLELEQKIPAELLRNAKGVMFLTILKGGIGLGGLVGTGIILARKPNWRFEWTAPCAIGLGGLQIGLNIGIEKTDHIIIIRDENVINKFHTGLRLGGDISLSVGPLGRDTNIGLTVNEKGIIPNVSYSMSKGAYLGFALEGSVITIRNDCNEQFFGQKCDVSEILNGSIKAPFNENYNKLCKALDDYVQPESNVTTTDKTSTTTRPDTTFTEKHDHVLNTRENTHA
jgi:lipid-binding SYLF domain-containing protein